MNHPQRRIVVGVVVAIVVTMLVPPFHLVTSSGAVVNKGYAFLLTPPSRATINVAVLLVEWLGVILVGALLWFMARGAAGASETGATSERAGVPPN